VNSGKVAPNAYSVVRKFSDLYLIEGLK